MDLTHEDVLRILKVIEESHYEELHLELGDLKLVLTKGGLSQCAESVSAPVSAQARKPITTPAQVEPSMNQARMDEDLSRADEVAQSDGLLPIRSPMLGTFYRSPSPGDPPFVEADQIVKDETQVCIIEVMKLFSAIHAGMRGRIAKICAQDGQLVEHNQILFLVEPLADDKER